VGDFVDEPFRAVPAGVVEAVVLAVDLDVAHAAAFGAVALDGEDDARVAGAVEVDVAHQGHVLGIALEDGGEIARGDGGLAGGGERGDDAAVAVVEFAAADERVVDAIVVGARVVVRGDDVDGVFAGLDVF